MPTKLYKTKKRKQKNWEDYVTNKRKKIQPLEKNNYTKIIIDANCLSGNPKETSFITQANSNQTSKHAKYYVRNKEFIKQRQAKYDLQHKDEIIQKQRRYNALHNEKIKEKQAKYNALYRDQIIQKQKSYDIQHEEQRKKRKTEYARRQAILEKFRLKIQVKDIVERLLKLLDKTELKTVTDVTVKQLELQSLVQKAFKIREKAFTIFIKEGNQFQDKIKNIINELNKIQEMTIESFLLCILGTKTHTPYSECYFYERSYNYFNDVNFSLQIDQNGVVWNLLIDGEYTFHKNKNKIVEWPCLRTCNISIDCLRKIAQFFNKVGSLLGEDMLNYFCNLNSCSNPLRRTDKLGHPITCIGTNCECESIIRLLNEIKCHFSTLRLVTKVVYLLKGLAEGIINITNVINKSTDEKEFIAAIKLLKTRLGMDESDINDIDTEMESNFQKCSIQEKEIFSMFGKQFTTINKLINDFADKPCVCCERLCRSLYLQSIATQSHKKAFENKSWLQLRAYIALKYESDFDESFQICKYCILKLNSDQLPARSVLNGLEVDEMPPELRNLNIFEQILIQKVKAFQTIVRLGPVRSKLPRSELVKGIKGRVVYLPLPLQDNVNALPQTLADHEMYIMVDGVPTKNKEIWRELVNVDKVHAALAILKKINPLYFDLSLNVNEIQNYIAGNDIEKFDNNDNAMIEKLSENDNIYQHYTIHPISSKIATTDLEHYRMKQIKATSVSLFEENLDLMCFPHMFPKGRFGKIFSRQVPLQQSEYRVSRLLNKDSRFRLNHQYLFHLFYDSEIKAISQAISFMLRKYKGGSCKVKNVIEKVQENDSDLQANLRSFFSTQRGTTEYWAIQRTNILCMAREFGPPTWFVTMSCAEYDWENLYEHLKNINSDVPNVVKMTPGELCAMDPVSVTSHYHARFHAIFNNLILSKINPILGHISHYFWRVEYQSRSAPHVHMLLWSYEAPIIGIASESEISEFIQKYVTCSMPDENESPQLHDLVEKYQTHRCSAYCLRKIKHGNKFFTQCKFGFPRTERTMFVLNDVHSSVRHRQKKKCSKRLYELERNCHEIYINDYNPALLFALKANVDVQYVGDETMAIARYITSYISKQEKTEMDEVWNDICHESVRSRFWSLGLKVLTHRECGSYEIADRLLGTHLFGKSEMIHFINTDYPEKRNRMLKSYSELQELKETDPESTDIYQHNLINEYYPNRSDDLENCSFYYFAKWYVKHTDDKHSRAIFLKNDMGCMVRRIKPIVINHYIHHPNKSIEEKEKYSHQMLLLFLPWRNESELLQGYLMYSNAFEHYVKELPEMLEHHQKLNKEKELEKKADEEFQKDSQTLEDDNNPENALQGCELIEDFQDIIDAFHGNGDNIDLNDNIKSLNDDQRRIFNNITCGIRHQKDHENNLCNCNDPQSQILQFVSGVGGSGKSFLIHTIKQWMNENIAEENNLSVAVCAPTGLAALNLNAVTVHRLFKLSVEHGKIADYNALKSEGLATLRQILGKIKLLIIDEVSMISSLLLTYIHKRLCEITNVEQPFGGVNVILLGDLLQLSPVKGNLPFIPLTRQEIKLRHHSIGAVNLWSMFQYDELMINVRQNKDHIYANILSNIRTGVLTKEHEEILKPRLIISSKCTDYADKVIECYKDLTQKNILPVCLLSTNMMCRSVNEKILNSFGLEIITIKSIDTLDGPIRGEYARKQAMEKLASLKDNLSMTAGLETELKLSLSARIIIRRNIDMKIGLVNGTTSKVIDFKFIGETIIKIQLQIDNISQPVWIERVAVKFQLLKYIYVHRRQFPISLAYALTVHKSQGMSLQCAIIDVGEKTFAEGMAYVALSRVTSLNGLYLLSLDKTKIFADIRAINEYNDLRKRYLPNLSPLPIGRIKQKCYVRSVKLLEKAYETQADKTRKKRPVKFEPLTIKDLKIARIERNNEDELQIFKGFLNPDNVSCYANVALQTLLHIPEFVSIINQSHYTNSIIDSLKELNRLNQCNDVKWLSSLQVRNAVGGIFREQEQQDVQQFIEELFEKLQDETNLNLSSIFGHTVTIKKRCQKCKSESIIGQPQYSVGFFLLNFPKNSRKKIKWTDFQSWKMSDSIRCNICLNTPLIETKSELTYCEKYLLVTLCRYDINLKKINTAVTGFNNRRLYIDNFAFETIATITHHGETITQGHYTCMIKDTVGWNNFNDIVITYKQAFSRELKDTYVILLRKVSEV